MKNTEIFNDFDMVVSVTQKTINDQMTSLTKMGVIPSHLILIRTVDPKTGAFVYERLHCPDNMDQCPDVIPHDGNGKPTVECIDGIVGSQIDISESGTNVSFLLNFQSGTAYFRDFESPDLSLKKFDMAGWTYAIDITLDLAAIEANDIGNMLKVPDSIRNQLHNFMSEQFTVSHLFLNFDSVDLVRFDPTRTKTPGNEGPGQILFVDFMIRYLNFLKMTGNPYILGYSVTANNRTKIPADKNVPDSIKPVGTTFTLYHDPNHPNLSNLNFVLATKGGHGKISGSAGTFDTNWIRPNEQLDAKMIYSKSVLIEKFVLKPVFEQISSGIYKQIQGKVHVPPGNNYESARRATPTGYDFSISNVTAGDDRYVNDYSVTIQNGPAGAALLFKGHLYVYKKVTQSHACIFEDAWAEVTAKVDWSAKVSFSASKNKAGQPILNLTNSFTIDHSEFPRDQNGCAKTLTTFLGGFGLFVDALTGFQDKFFFTKLFDSVLDLHPNVGNAAVALNSLPGAVQNVVILPAGQVFFFKDVAADPQGNLSLELSYKSAS